MKLLALAFALSTGQADSISPVTAPAAEAVLISRQFSFTEGPAPDREGNVYFTDQPNNQIWKYSTGGQLSLFLDSAGRSNGLYIDRKGNIIACADADNELWRIAPDGKKTVIMKDFRGKKLNGPNDLWIAPKGGIFFTDPYYQRNYWTRKQGEMEGQKVFYLPPGRSQPVIAAEDIKKPNGIVGTPDGKYLYVADIGDNKTYRYRIGKKGRLSDRILFCPKGGDGITLDERGNLYICGNGISVFNPEGVQIAHIPVPEKWTANACFGGKDRDVLFITASTAVYTVKMAVKGVE
ncbi:SMP-30/gluconolactonase/LRE family protein [Chitinophaga lutea]